MVYGIAKTNWGNVAKVSAERLIANILEFVPLILHERSDKSHCRPFCHYARGESVARTPEYLRSAAQRSLWLRYPNLFSQCHTPCKKWETRQNRYCSMAA